MGEVCKRLGKAKRNFRFQEAKVCKVYTTHKSIGNIYYIRQNTVTLKYTKI